MSGNVNDFRRESYVNDGEDGFAKKMEPTGGAAVSSDSVVEETAYGLTKNAGASSEYSRGDHTHGTPAMPTANQTGAVGKPATSSTNQVAVFAGSGGSSVKASPVEIDDNGNVSNANSVTLDTTPTSPSSTIGTLRWNSAEGCAEIVYPNGVVLQLGRELYRWCKNQTGVTIPDGTPVYASGTLGASGQIIISPYIADGSIPHYVYLGITTETILNGESGNVTTDGQIRGLDTSGFAQSDVLYVSATTAGTFTNVRPSTPNFIIPTAFVVSVHAVVGAIEVRVPTIHSADECNFDNYGTSLAATNVEAAIKETLARLETQETNNTGNNTGDETTLTILTKIGDGSKISSTYLPSYVDDAVEAEDFASLPVTGETGKIYVTIDTGYQYRWSGSVYVEIKDSGETAASLGVLVNGTGAATPNDTDIIATAEAGGILKKLSWTNAKAFLKTYFDTLYLGITGTAADSTKVGGITISGTPTTGHVPTATSGTAATWQAPVVPTVPSFNPVEARSFI